MEGSLGRRTPVSLLFLVLSLLVTTCASQQGLTMNVYNNTALTGTPIHTGTLPSLLFTQPAVPSSIEILGTIQLEAGYDYSFYCNLKNTQIVFLWLDDHMVCQQGAYLEFVAPTKNNFTYGTDNPLTILPYGKTSLTLRMQIFNNITLHNNMMMVVEVLMAKGSQQPPAFIPTTILSTQLDPLEVKRRALQQGLLVGWGQWVYLNWASFVLLPSSEEFTMTLCRLSTQECQTTYYPSRSPPHGESNTTVRAGPIAWDRSYAQFYMSFHEMNISVSYGVRQPRDVIALVETVADCNSAANCSDYYLTLAGSMAWYRAGDISVLSPDHLQITPWGLPTTDIYVTGNAVSKPTAPNTLTLRLDQGAFTITTSKKLSVAVVADALHHARTKEFKRYAQYGDLAETKEMVQSAVGWNTVYVPAEYGPIIPPSRDWNWIVPSPASTEFTYIMFDWDNLFGSLMAAVDGPNSTAPMAKLYAYSNLIQIIKSRSFLGFVPNWAAGGWKTVDRSEPPLGARVLEDIYLKFGDLWLVEFLYDDLMTWHQFNWRYRVLPQSGLITLGSQLCFNASECFLTAAGESGLDQSPMWDCPGADPDGNHGDCTVFFNTTTHQIQLSVVGMSSLVTMDAVSLARLATLLGKTEDAAMLNAHAKLLGTRLRDLAWDAENRVYSNIYANGTFKGRITPTSFYPLITKYPTDDQVVSSIKNWLVSPDHFCIDITGGWPSNTINSDDCYWGMPSIEKSDRSYMRPQSYIYWRGYTWAPMVLFTYWGLREYDHLPLVEVSRKAMVTQMLAMSMNTWRTYHHVCENYSPFKNTTECTGGTFYHWGALNGYVALQEAGYVPYDFGKKLV